MAYRELSSKQAAILDFCFSVIEADGIGVNSAEIARAIGANPASLGTTLTGLRIRGIIDLLKDSGENGGGCGWMVVGVRHPELGDASVPSIVYDIEHNVWRMDADFSPSNRIKRKCLHCCKEFLAVGRFVRMCTPCKNTMGVDGGLVGGASGYFRYVSNIEALKTGRIGGFIRP